MEELPKRRPGFSNVLEVRPLSLLHCSHWDSFCSFARGFASPNRETPTSVTEDNDDRIRNDSSSLIQDPQAPHN